MWGRQNEEEKNIHESKGEEKTMRFHPPVYIQNHFEHNKLVKAPDIKIKIMKKTKLHFKRLQIFTQVDTAEPTGHNEN